MKLPVINNFLKDPRTRCLSFKERTSRNLKSSPVAVREIDDKTYDVCLVSPINEGTGNSTIPTSFLNMVHRWEEAGITVRAWISQCEAFDGYDPNPEDVTEVNTISRTDLEKIQIVKNILKSTKNEKGWSDYIVVNTQGEPVRRSKKSNFKLPQ